MVDSPARGNANAKSLKGVSEVHAEFEKRLFQWVLWADAGGTALIHSFDSLKRQRNRLFSSGNMNHRGRQKSGFSGQSGFRGLKGRHGG